MVHNIHILPVKIIHIIFDYLNTVDILQSFFGVSNYIDNTVRLYKNYSLNMKNISKMNFNLICNHIKPSQVVSLTLSGEIYTPGLVNLFFRQFQLEEFIGLRSLHLHSIELEEILANVLYKMSILTELRIFIIDECYALDTRTILPNIHSPLSHISVSFKSSTIYRENFFNLLSSRVDSIEYVNCPFEDYADLSYLCARMPLLHTLKARVSDFPSTTELSPIVSLKLQRLDLSFDSKLKIGNLTFNLIKRLLVSLTFQLKYLTLSGEINDVDLVNGNLWKEYLSTYTSLRTFDFYFLFSFGEHLDVTNERVKTFKSDYWCIEKKWYVTFNPNSVFTVPHFSPHKIELLYPRDPSHYIWTTAPSDDLCIQNTKTVIFDNRSLAKSQKEKKIYYKNVEHIDWQSFPGKDDQTQPIIDLPLIRTTFDLSRVIIFEGVPTKNSTIFLDYIALLPRLEEIRFHYTRKLFHKVPTLPNIRRLRFSLEERDEINFMLNIDDLCRVFYRVEHIHLMTWMEKEVIGYLIRRLKHLCSIVVFCQPDCEMLTYVQQWNEQETRLSLSLVYGDFSCNKLVAFWIDTSQKHLIKRFKYRKPSQVTKQRRCILL